MKIGIGRVFESPITNLKSEMLEISSDFDRDCIFKFVETNLSFDFQEFGSSIIISSAKPKSARFFSRISAYQLSAARLAS